MTVRNLIRTLRWTVRDHPILGEGAKVIGVQGTADPDFDFDDLNRPLPPSDPMDAVFGLVLWGLIAWAVVSLVRWVFG